VRFAHLGELPDEADVRIEVPRGSFVKRRPDGSIDFVSPIPCPYNYGSMTGHTAPDGDPLDAVVLGPRIPYGRSVRAPIRAAIDFIDADTPDPKIICAADPLTHAQRRDVERFFRSYAVLKRMLHRVRGQKGRTACLGWLACICHRR
jgi:inorganic pyrophosphatase